MKVNFVVGATASGKSDFALQEAVKLAKSGVKAAIFNCDSIQVYKGLVVGSALPSAEEFAQVPHFLYAYVDKGQRITVGQYVREFYRVMAEIKNDFAEIFVVGGTGFYFQGIEKGLYDIGAANPEMTAKLEKEISQADGAQRLHEELQQVDPQSAHRISVNDHYRLVRALEIWRTHGKSMTDVQAEFAKQQKPFPWPLKKFGFRGSKYILHERVRKRTEKMLQMGLLEEVRTLLAEGFGEWEVLQSIGYRETLNFIRAGGNDQKALLEEIVMQTMKLAKKQNTWFQRDKDIQWMEL